LGTVVEADVVRRPAGFKPQARRGIAWQNISTIRTCVQTERCGPANPG